MVTILSSEVDVFVVGIRHCDTDGNDTDKSADKILHSNFLPVHTPRKNATTIASVPIMVLTFQKGSSGSSSIVSSFRKFAVMVPTVNLFVTEHHLEKFVSISASLRAENDSGSWRVGVENLLTPATGAWHDSSPITNVLLIKVYSGF